MMPASMVVIFRTRYQCWIIRLSNHLPVTTTVEGKCRKPYPNGYVDDYRHASLSWHIFCVMTSRDDIIANFFPPVLLKRQPFLITDHFETSTLRDPKMTMNTAGSNVPHRYVLPVSLSVPNYSWFHIIFQLQAISHFLIQLYRMTSNDIPESQISLILSPRLQSFTLYEHFRVIGRFETSGWII